MQSKSLENHRGHNSVAKNKTAFWQNWARTMPTCVIHACQVTGSKYHSHRNTCVRFSDLSTGKCHRFSDHVTGCKSRSGFCLNLATKPLSTRVHNTNVRISTTFVTSPAATQLVCNWICCQAGIHYVTNEHPVINKAHTVFHRQIYRQ